MIIPSCVLDWHITANGHIWIDGCMGGGVETTDSGRYYTAKTVQRALNHYEKKYKQYCAEYSARGTE
jgi:hypothetical protein